MVALVKTFGYVAVFTVVMMVVFLFREGLAVFSRTPVEPGYSLLVHRQNPVGPLSAEQIKQVFDRNVTNWKALGGADEPIVLFTHRELAPTYSGAPSGATVESAPAYINRYVDSLPGTLAFFNDSRIDVEAMPAVRRLPVVRINPVDFLSGREWFPTARPAAVLGALPLLAGTLLVTLFSIILALPLGLAAAVYLAEIADNRVRQLLKPMIELLAGIPSVVYGFFGLVVIVPFIQRSFQLPVGESALAGSIVLGIMALPTIISISEDALRATPRHIKEASLALGASRWQTIREVTIPSAASGITAAAILGAGRAIGETMAVLMVTGNSAVLPASILQPVRTIPATLAAELGEAPFGGVHFKALFALGCLLFLLTLAINVAVERIIDKTKPTERN